MPPRSRLTEYPFSAEEDAALAALCGGPELVKELLLCQSTVVDGPWRANSIGGSATPNCRDIRIAPVVGTPFSVVGHAAEAVKLWSFHNITRSRNNATIFDLNQDGPLFLSKEKLRLLVDTHKGRIALQEGFLIANEDTIVWLEYSPDHAPQQTIPISFPSRGPKHGGGVIYLP
ncbi:hypothetical protein B0H19DRAFT_1386363 [Mycena capillaripes]|nr:hypothetical protein B0H19DRAFT_1386363 [Mycena capillaripes]